MNDIIKKIDTESITAIANENAESKDKCLEYGRKLYSEALTGGMNDDIDARMKSYLSRVKATAKAMNERRKPVTQLLDKIKKVFTTYENELSGAFLDDMQKLRDDYVKDKIEATNATPNGVFVSSPIDAKISTVINVKNKDGYINIFNLWWETEGKAMDDEELRKKMSFMITCANKKHKDGIDIVSDNIEYIEEIKAKK